MNNKESEHCLIYNFFFFLGTVPYHSLIIRIPKRKHVRFYHHMIGISSYI
uniref:Uncharacterized protein MANES_05G010400 n=1 Tax=Rhizophora mucronata TaxID=61149 RepID=A0A2P2IT83_RHIMU